MITQKGEANPHIRIFDLDKKEFLPDSIGPVMFNDSRGVSMTWLPDDKGLLYTQAPPATESSEKYYNGKIILHITGTDPKTDEPIFGINIIEGIRLKNYETPYVYSFKNSPYHMARIRAGDADNYAFAVHYSEINGKQTPWKKLKDYLNLGDSFDANDKYLYAATNGRPQYRVVKINMETGETPEPFISKQDEVIACTDVNHSSGIVAGKDILYVLLRKVGNMQIMKVDYKTRSVSLLPVPDKGTLSGLALLGSNDLLFAYGSAIRSIQFLHYDFLNNKVAPLPFAAKVYDASGNFKTKVIFVPSRDGKEIPVSLVY